MAVDCVSFWYSSNFRVQFNLQTKFASTTSYTYHIEHRFCSHFISMQRSSTRRLLSYFCKIRNSNVHICVPFQNTRRRFKNFSIMSRCEPGPLPAFANQQTGKNEMSEKNSWNYLYLKSLWKLQFSYILTLPTSSEKHNLREQKSWLGNVYKRLFSLVHFVFPIQITW